MGPHSLQQHEFEYVGECAHFKSNKKVEISLDVNLVLGESSANAIHLCCTCYAIITRDGAEKKGYTPALLREWKQQAEERAMNALFVGEIIEKNQQSEIRMLKMQIAQLQLAKSKLSEVNKFEFITDEDEPF
jgi:hypothetical protein